MLVDAIASFSPAMASLEDHRAAIKSSRSLAKLQAFLQAYPETLNKVGSLPYNSSEGRTPRTSLEEGGLSEEVLSLLRTREGQGLT